MTLTVQFVTILTMIAMGIWIGVAVDTYGRFMHPNRWSWALFLCDVLFWIVQGLLIFFVLLNVNDGEIRFYIFLALLCGFAAYKALLQTMYNRLLTFFIRIANALIRVCLSIFKTIVVKPITGLLKLVLAILRFLGNLFYILLRFLFKLITAPFYGLFRLIWRLLPNSSKNVVKKVAGLFKIMQNKIRKWVERI